jgi:hypothetical protein
MQRASLAMGMLLTWVSALFPGCLLSAKTHAKYATAGPVAIAAQTKWTGQSIVIDNANGSLTIQGTPGLMNIEVNALPFAFADNESDATIAVSDVSGTISLGEPGSAGNGTFAIHCGMAAAGHGSAPRETTGCDLVVAVPAGSQASGITLTATAHAGAIVATGPISGGVQLQSDNGSVSASIAPTPGVTVAASTQKGDVTLTLPASFAADALSLQAPQGTVAIEGFSDLTPSSTSRGVKGSGASSVLASSASGNVTLVSM